MHTFVESVERDRKTIAGNFLNSLEPDSLVSAFLEFPPEGFHAWNMQSVIGNVPCFQTDYNILTTLDDSDGDELLDKVRGSKLLNKLCTMRTIFVGTTVSEHSLYPKWISYAPLIKDLLHRGKRVGAKLLVIKDIPCNSPLLSIDANRSAAKLLDDCKKADFLLLAGQALAYVPIDFESVEEYLSRLSSRRRKEFRRKLKSKQELQIEVIQTGDMRFYDERLVASIYELYENVYAQSKYHFDKLSPEFFAQVLQNASSNGVVFMYKRAGELIGFNLCFVINNMLVDKYVGFKYPAARECNLYFVSWFVNLEYALQHRLRFYIAGWTDPEVKTALGARFTFTQHAVYVRNPVLRAVLSRLKHFFEPDANWAEQVKHEAAQSLGERTAL